MIIDLRLQPGAMVSELSLAAEIELGRTPVHEAVARLVVDRLVKLLPRRGLMVASIGLEHVKRSNAVMLTLLYNTRLLPNWQSSGAWLSRRRALAKRQLCNGF